jgi:hypothetical protein
VLLLQKLHIHGHPFCLEIFLSTKVPQSAFLPIQAPIHMVPEAPFLGYSGRGVKVFSHHHVVTRLGINRDTNPLLNTSSMPLPRQLCFYIAHSVHDYYPTLVQPVHFLMSLHYNTYKIVTASSDMFRSYRIIIRDTRS